MPSGRDDSRLPIGQIVAIVIASVAGGLWIYWEPLQTSRPADSGTESRRSPVPEQVPARLWQDPLAAAEEHEREDTSRTTSQTIILDSKARLRPPSLEVGPKASHADRHSLKTLANQVWMQRPADSTLALLVMTNGSLTPDAAETRRRDRYAVIAALGTSCFVPADREFIRYVKWKRGAEEPETLVPFEWFDLRKLRSCVNDDNPPYSRVLVLWINENRVEKEPIRALRNLIAQLTTTTPEPTGGRTDEPSLRDSLPQQSVEPHRLLPVVFKIIGPRSSAVLREMLREAWRMPAPSEPDRQGDLPLFSPWATASQEIFMVFFGTTDSQAPRWLQQQLRRAGIELEHHVLSDLDLSRSLVRELGRRGIDWSTVVDNNAAGDSIALISEWDTFYARTLSLEFTAAVCEVQRKCLRNGEDEKVYLTELLKRFKSETNLDDLKIKRYYYFGGLDGYQPGKGRSKSEAKKPEDLAKLLDGGSDRKETLESLERPEGDPQLDYVSRLADKIARDDRERRRACWFWERWPQGCGLKAVGIFGSETYDKLLLLQALRKRLPDTIFFTTDLDARLTHPHEYPWARNLIIASPYGLSLDEKLQRGAPPFRDTYQASTYFAVLRAIERLEPAPHPCRTGESAQGSAGCLYSLKGLPPTIRFLDPQTPRIYEVGRNGAVDLTVDASEGLPAYRVLGLIPVECGSPWFYLRPDRCQAPSVRDIHPRRDAPPDLLDAAEGIFKVGLLVITAIASAWALRPQAQDDLRRMKGLVKVAAGSAVAAILIVPLLLADGQGGEPFTLSDGVSIWPTEATRVLTALLCVVLLCGGRRWLRTNAETLSWRFALNNPQPAGGGSWSNVCARWTEYKTHTGSLESHRPSVPVVVAALYALGLSVGWIWGFPFVPSRGQISFWVDRVLYFFVVVPLFLGLTVFVFAVSRHCVGFIQAVTLAPQNWSAPLLPDDLTSYLTIKLIAERTRVIKWIMYFPLVALVCFTLARSAFFDNWGHPAPLIVMWLLLVSLVITSAYRLRRAAEAARRMSLEQLRRLQLQEGGRNEPRDNTIQRVLDEIQAMRDGAFGSFTEGPVIGTALLALLGLLQEILIR
ncbi:hypothetical protein [Nitrospira sp. Kam-Ns4a]